MSCGANAYPQHDALHDLLVVEIRCTHGSKWMIPSVPFKEAYFLEDALKFRAALKIPLVYVGGLVSRDKIDEVLDDGFEAVQMHALCSMSRGLSTACVPKRMHVATAGIVIIALPGCIPSRWHAISIEGGASTLSEKGDRENRSEGLIFSF